MVLCARIQSIHAAWCWLNLGVRFRHHHVLSGASCVFMHPSSRGFVLVLSFWISSCTCCETVAPSSPYWHHVHLLYLVVIALLLTLLRGFNPASRTEYIPKYNSIENFIKLPFQQVLIHLNRSLDGGAMAVSLQHCFLSRISARATIGDSAISACKNVRLPCRLIRCNIDFMELLRIQIYLIFFFWGSCKHRDDIVIISSIDPEMYVWSSYWSLLGHHVEHPWLKKSLPSLHEHNGMKSCSVVLGMVASETYSLNKQSSKRD
jgi:hypothetical protein